MIIEFEASEKIKESCNNKRFSNIYVCFCFSFLFKNLTAPRAYNFYSHTFIYIYLSLLTEQNSFHIAFIVSFF
jgi:catabolite regulation protein CreA